MPELVFAIVGTGAVGGFYGGRLQKAGMEVHFLLHSDFEHVRRHGLIIESKDGDFTLGSVHAYVDPREMPPCDVVVVTLKTTRNPLLDRILPPILKPDGVVVLLQNGLGEEEAVARIVGPERLIGGLSFLCSNKVGPGHICHLDYGRIALGEYTPQGKPAVVTDRMRRIAAAFERAGIEVELSDDLILARWKKLVWNIPFNGLSVVLNANTDRLVSEPHCRELVAALMDEVVRGADAVGRRVPPDFVQRMIRDTEKMKPYRTSMKIDYDERRPMEVESIFGNPLRAAATAGTDLPRIGMLYRELKFLDAANGR